MKPDERIYQRALTRIGVQPHQAVFVDDFPQNIRGADRVGLHTVWFRNTDQLIGELNTILGL